jgi:hypothetical protein
VQPVFGFRTDAGPSLTRGDLFATDAPAGNAGNRVGRDQHHVLLGNAVAYAEGEARDSATSRMLAHIGRDDVAHGSRRSRSP